MAVSEAETSFNREDSDTYDAKDPLQLRNNIKQLILKYQEGEIDIERCVSETIELCSRAKRNSSSASTSMNSTQRRRSSIFDLPPPQTGRRKSSTYDANGNVRNEETVLYQNKDID
ncbi:unnamed protein product [Didymodactylos carnosus]|uniref:Uncharacterized protein n=1 Tax=Didymodactylos carnosus TaxID=1234261 RepID=A0A813WQ93_9BILA|nr:unnamed protein product [Didymodactylos carnosus]CAF0913644.1 unnamed protein product [Didymodactylos carnosus]CAF3646722.1 unnamed protein product [Didymodactylos carnosus]CAF3692307.1 unnamed protein product [Didymodactylos carnosus]